MVERKFFGWLEFGEFLIFFEIFLLNLVGAMRSSIMMAYLHPVLIPITWFLSRPNGISDLFGDVSATVFRPRRKSEFDFARYSFQKI